MLIYGESVLAGTEVEMSVDVNLALEVVIDVTVVDIAELVKILAPQTSEFCIPAPTVDFK